MNDKFRLLLVMTIAVVIATLPNLYPYNGGLEAHRVLGASSYVQQGQTGIWDQILGFFGLGKKKTVVPVISAPTKLPPPFPKIYDLGQPLPSSTNSSVLR